MRRGESQIVSFVLLFAIGAIMATAFYYIYAGSGYATGEELADQRDDSLSRLKSLVTFFAPQSMKNGSDYYGAIYNSGVITLHGLELKFSHLGTEIGIPLTDINGTNLTYMSAGDIAFYTLTDRPLKSDIIMFHSDELNYFHVFPENVSRMGLLFGQSSLNSIDGVFETIDETECNDNNTFSWYVGMPKEDIDALFVDGYANTSIGASYVNVLDNQSTQLVIDSFGGQWSSVTYEISNANYSGNTLELCVNVTKGLGINLDYFRVVVLY